MPRNVKVLIEKFKISVLELPKSCDLGPMFSNFLFHFTIDQVVPLNSGLYTPHLLKSSEVLVISTSKSVCECAVTLVGSVIKQRRLLTSSRSLKIFPSPQ